MAGIQTVTLTLETKCSRCKAGIAAGEQAETILNSFFHLPGRCAKADRPCQCRCDGWCEMCSSLPCAGTNHRANLPARKPFSPRRRH